ncbi:hypothetical protein ACHAW6_015970 [Cyclotella cf. meneghiniana]
MLRQSSRSATFTLIASVACCLLRGDGIATSKVAALVINPCYSSRRKSYSSRRLHQRRGYDDELDPVNFYQRESRELPHFDTHNKDNGNAFYYADRMGKDLQQNDADFDAKPDYRNPTTTSTSSRNNARKDKNKFSKDIGSIVSKVFPNAQKQQAHPMQHTDPISSTIPNLSHMISVSNEDMEKFARNAEAGGKIVSNFVRGAILNAAKLAIEVLEQNNNNNHRNRTEERNEYNDVCDFDHDLCREIEDALAASSLADGRKEDASSNFIGGDRASERTLSDSRKDNRDDEAGKYFSRTENGSNKFEEYYWRSLEEQLSESDGERSTQEKPRKMQQQKKGPSWNDTSLMMSDDRGLLPDSMYPYTRLTHQEQLPLSENEPMPLLKKKRNDILSNDDSMSKPVMTRVDDWAMGHDAKESKDDYAKLFNAIQDGPYDKMSNPFNDQKTRVNGQRKKRDDISERRYEAQDSVKLDITDEALAFARSLNLDVYEIYLSRDAVDEDAVITLQDVLAYYDRMKGQIRVRPRQRSTSEDHQRNMDDAVYSGPRGNKSKEQTERVGRNTRLAKESYNYNIHDAVYSDPRDERFSVASEPQRSGKTTPSVRYRHVSNPLRRQSKSELSPPKEPERVPRFRQYPEQRDASPAPLRPSVQRNIPDVNPTVQSLGGSRREIKSQSSLSQLIDPNPQRNREYDKNARGGPRENTFSTVPLAKLVQNPSKTEAKEAPSASLNPPPSSPLPFEQISTAQFREPYQGGRVDNFGSDPDSQHRSEGTHPKQSSEKQLLSNIHIQKHEVASSKPASSSFTLQNESAYCTNDALLMAEQYGVDLRKVAASSDEPISAEDVRHYIESRKNMRASLKDQYSSQRDSSTYIDNELTYEEFASYFDTDTMGRLQRLQDQDSRERIE